MKALVTPLAAASLALFAAARPAEADLMGTLFQADPMPWTMLVFVVGLVIGASAIHLLRKRNDP